MQTNGVLVRHAVVCDVLAREREGGGTKRTNQL